MKKGCAKIGNDFGMSLFEIGQYRVKKDMPDRRQQNEI